MTSERASSASSVLNKFLCRLQYAVQKCELYLSIGKTLFLQREQGIPTSEASTQVRSEPEQANTGKVEFFPLRFSQAVLLIHF